MHATDITRTVQSEQGSHMGREGAARKPGWSTDSGYECDSWETKTTEVRTKRISSKSRAASFFMAETLVLNRRIVSRPNVRIAEYLKHSVAVNYG